MFGTVALWQEGGHDVCPLVSRKLCRLRPQEMNERFFMMDTVEW